MNEKLLEELLRNGFEDSHFKVNAQTLGLASGVFIDALAKGSHVAYAIIQTSDNPKEYIGLVKRRD